MLRDGGSTGALGCRSNIARFISSWIVVGLVRMGIVYMSASIGISYTEIAMLSWLVGVYLAWRFIWNNDIWWGDPEQYIVSDVDVE
jgi:hypothetical protein